TLPSPVDCSKFASAPSVNTPLILWAMPKLPPAEDAGTVPALMSVARVKRLVPPLVKLLPSRPTLLPLPLLPSRACHWMPNCAALSVLTSAIRHSTSTSARRPSSLSITARNWRYSGGGAVMMSELVAGSAWICPPVDGSALFCTASPAEWLLMLLVPPVVAVLAVLALVCGVAALAPLPVPVLVVAGLSLAREARNTAASLVASAFFRCTT